MRFNPATIIRASAKAVLLILMATLISYAADVNQLRSALDQMADAKLDESSLIEVNDFVLKSRDLKLNFISGHFCFFKPLVFDNDTIHYGAFFVGAGRFDFVPPVEMETDQLLRFFESDSLAREFSEMLLLFDERSYWKIRASGEALSKEIDFVEFDGYKDHIEQIKQGHIYSAAETAYLLPNTLRSCLYPLDKPFLVASTQWWGVDKVQYIFDQYDTEEVKLLRHRFLPGESYMELINSYSIYTDESYRMINGIRKDPVTVSHYDIEAMIKKNGDFVGRADVKMNVLLKGTQFLKFSLHPELTVDSVTGAPGLVPFVYHFEKRGDESFDRYLILDKPLPNGKEITLSFYYHGDMIEKSLGEFFVDAGAVWYPRFGFLQRATFDQRFRTHKSYTFVATGELVESKKIKDTLFTRWKVSQPTANVSFNIGHFKVYNFSEADAPPVKVYYSKSLHSDIVNALSESMVSTGRHMEKQIAEDVINSLRLFSSKFGDYPGDDLRVTEVLASHGEAFPGLVHLGFDTWINTDRYGVDCMFRAHEVAHQWWGVSVGYASYHDTWLSEGLAEYSALLYYQIIEGNDKFLDKLKNIRKEIFSNRKYLFSSGEEAGPIALGYRTSSSKTRGDYSLIIYDKGAYVLHMLRNLLIDLETMNEDRFFNLLREFYDKYKNGRATTTGFKKLTEKYTGIDMDWFFNQWIYGNELPEYKFDYEVTQRDDGKYDVNCHVVTKGVSEDFKMFVPISIEYESGQKAYLRPLIDRLDMHFSLPPLDSKPKRLRFNAFESVLANVKQ